MNYFLDLRDKHLTDDIRGYLDNELLTGLIVTGKTDLGFNHERILTITDKSIFENEQKVGEIITIETPEDMQNQMEHEFIDLKYLIIDTKDWHIIPIENLIAKYADKNIQLLATASSKEEINLLQGILELGVDGCILQANTNAELEELLENLLTEAEKLELVELEVSSVERIGMGDRVCVDTCSILQSGEGLLVGSTSAVFSLVEAEVEQSGFVNSRPFRVNAGVVASYVLNGEKTNYLSELQAGSEVQIVNRKGAIKYEKVARVKIERRPLVLVKLEFEEKQYPVVLQDAETVKLITTSSSIRVDKLKKGDKVLCKVSDKARHFGMEIDEFIEER